MKANTKVYTSTVIAALGGLLFGFDTAVISGTTDALQKHFGLSEAMLGFTVATALIGTTEAPFSVAELPDGEDVELRIFVDKYLVEVFANDREAVVATHLEHADQRGFDAFTVGTPTRLNQVDIWKLKPTNQGFLEAQESRNWQPSVSAKLASPPAAEATSGQAE